MAAVLARDGKLSARAVKALLVTGPDPKEAGFLEYFQSRINEFHDRGQHGSVDAYLDEGVDIVRLWARWARNKPGLVNEIQARGTQVWIFTGNLTGPKLDRVVDFGADGLITDHPAAVLRLH